jgi:hypothetical protein
LDNPQKAMELGKGAQEYANQRFNIERFKQNWIDTFHSVVNKFTSSTIQNISVTA